MDTFVINLDRDHQRMAGMARQLHALRLSFERFQAIDGTNLPKWLQNYFQLGSPAQKMVPGEIGCYASHLSILQKVAQSGRPALVLEDDLEISESLPLIIRDIENLSMPFDLLRLACSSRRRVFAIHTLACNYQIVKYSRVGPGTGAYIVSPDGAHKFLTAWPHRFYPVDQDMRRTWDSRLEILGIYPTPIKQNVLTSSIDRMAHSRAGRKRMRGDHSWAWLKKAEHDIRWLGLHNWLTTLAE